MKITDNIAVISKRNKEQKNKTMSKLGCISKIVNSLSILCSVLGTSLFAAIYFGPTHILDYRRAKIIDECAHYLVISSVILSCLGILLSLFKKDSKRNSAEIQINRSRTVSSENSLVTSIGAQNSKLTSHTLKPQEFNSEVESSTITKNIKHATDSSKTLQDNATPKPTEIVAKTLNHKIESPDLNEKRSQVNKQLVLYEKQSKNHEPNLPAVRSPQVPNFWNILSANASGNNSATELTASRKVTVFPGGIAQSQEEYQVRRTTLFKCTESGFPSPELSEPKLYHDSNQKFRTPFPTFNESRKNHVSDVLAKFESMNIYY